MSSNSQNKNMFQFSTRSVDEDEELYLMEIGGINIWVDADRVPVIVDLPMEFYRMDYVK